MNLSISKLGQEHLLTTYNTYNGDGSNPNDQQHHSGLPVMGGMLGDYTP